MADPRAKADLRRLMEDLSRAAQAFASGLDGSPMVPSEIRADVQRWRERLEARGARLDYERWLLGLLTLARLSHAPAPERAAATEVAAGVVERAG